MIIEVIEYIEDKSLGFCLENMGYLKKEVLK